MMTNPTNSRINLSILEDNKVISIPNLTALDLSIRRDIRNIPAVGSRWVAYNESTGNTSLEARLKAYYSATEGHLLLYRKALHGNHLTCKIHLGANNILRGIFCITGYEMVSDQYDLKTIHFTIVSSGEVLYEN